MGKSRLKPKVKKEIAVVPHSRVDPKKGVEEVEGHQRSMDVNAAVSDVHKSKENAANPDRQRREFVDDMNQKFSEMNSREETHDDFRKKTGQREQAKRLTSEEIGTIDKYTEEVGFNEKLRKSIKDGHTNDPDVKLLDSVVSKAEPLANDTLVVRGSRRDFHKTIGRELKVGEVITDHGFMSTTTQPDVASNFMWKQNKDTGKIKMGTFYQISLPKGTKAFPINAKEHEYLLSRNMNFEVLNNQVVDMNKDSQKLPRILKQYGEQGFNPLTWGVGSDADTGGGSAGGSTGLESEKLRLIHLRALPNENQRGKVSDKPLQPKKTVIRRKKRK